MKKLELEGDAVLIQQAWRKFSRQLANHRAAKERLVVKLHRATRRFIAQRKVAAMRQERDRERQGAAGLIQRNLRSTFANRGHQKLRAAWEEAKARKAAEEAPVVVPPHHAAPDMHGGGGGGDDVNVALQKLLDRLHGLSEGVAGLSDKLGEVGGALGGLGEGLGRLAGQVGAAG